MNDITTLIQENQRLHARVDELTKAYKALLEAQPVQEPCGWQFYQDGKWHNGMDNNDHKANTVAAGFPVRDVYPEAQPEPVQDEDLYDLAVKADNGGQP